MQELKDKSPFLCFVCEKKETGKRSNLSNLLTYIVGLALELRDIDSGAALSNLMQYQFLVWVIFYKYLIWLHRARLLCGAFNDFHLYMGFSALSYHYFILNPNPFFQGRPAGEHTSLMTKVRHKGFELSSVSQLRVIQTWVSIISWCFLQMRKGDNASTSLRYMKEITSFTSNSYQVSGRISKMLNP